MRTASPRPVRIAATGGTGTGEYSGAEALRCTYTSTCMQWYWSTLHGVAQQGFFLGEDGDITPWSVASTGRYMYTRSRTRMVYRSYYTAVTCDVSCTRHPTLVFVYEISHAPQPRESRISSTLIYGSGLRAATCDTSIARYLLWNWYATVPPCFYL